MTTAPQTARHAEHGPVRRSRLPGGLRLVTEQVPGARAVDLGFFVAVGSRDEPSGLHGASHFLEHVLFKGTPTRDARAISEAIESHGGDFNAYTTREYTCFHARVLADQFVPTLDVFCDMLANSLVRPADVATEREVILDEIAMHADDPGEVAIDALIGILFEGSELAPQVIGSSSSIRRMSAARVRDYWRSRYTSDRIVLSVVGEVDHDELTARLAGFDRALAAGAGSIPLARRAATAAATAHTTQRTTELAQSSVVLGFGAFGAVDPRREALALAAVALGGGMSSRLFQEVREQRALAYTIDASEAAWQEAGLFTIDWQSLPERTAEIMDVVREVVATVLREGFTADELTSARGQLVGQTILHFENPSARMSRWGSNELVGDRRSIDEVLDAYRAVDLKKLNAVTREVLGQVPAVSIAGAPGGRRAARLLQQRWPRA